MVVRSIAVGMTKTNGGDQFGVEVAEVRWRDPELPSRLLFAAAIEELYALVEIPWFPDSVWAEVENDLEIRREALDAQDCEEVVTGRLRTWVASMGAFG